MPHEGNGCDKRQWVLSALDQHECRLTRYAMRIAADEEAARDAVQHVFLKLCDQSPTELNGRLLPWLYTVCRNKIVDQLRRSGRHESLDSPDTSALVGREPDPALTAEQQDLGEWLRELVEALPTSLREVLDLWLDGFSHPEIAEITEHTPGHVRVLVHRALTRLRDFDNDAKDAGEIGAGHTVTAMYEIVPSKATEQLTSTATSLKYQRPATPAEPPKELTAAAETGELLTLFLRYKQPDADESTLSEFTVKNQRRAFDDASTDFRFAAAVASYGLVLRNSEFRGNATLTSVEEIASSSIGSDSQGHRTEFLDLVRKAGTLQTPRR